MSQILELASMVIKNIPKMPKWRMQKCIENPKEVKNLLKFLAWYAGTFEVVVDYGCCLGVMIQRAGYTCGDANITQENFPPPEAFYSKKRRKITLFNFNRNIGSDEAIRKMGSVGYRPVNLAERLAFAKCHPQVNCQFPIACLGSVWRPASGAQIVSFSHKELKLRPFDHDWDVRAHFPGVKK